MHDERCEAAWNDGLCACSERAENAAHGFYRPADPAPATLIGRLVSLLRIG